MADAAVRSAVSTVFSRLTAGAVLAAVSAAAGFLVGRSLDDPPATGAPVAPRAPKSQPPRASLPAPRADAPRAKPPSAPEEPPPVEEPAPTGLRSEHDIERILRSHLKRDPPMERVREVVVLRQALFDAQRRVPQDWEDEALRRVIRSVKGEVPPLSKDAATDAALLLKVARQIREPFVWAVAEGPRFSTLFEPASDGDRVDVTKPPATVRAHLPLVLILPEGIHDWDGRLAGTWTPSNDVTFQGAGMDTTLLRLRSRSLGRSDRLTVFRDLTLHLDDAIEGDEGQRLRLERCRVVGWEQRGSSLFQGFRGLVHASDCRFEGGYRPKGGAVLMDDRKVEILVRFERCRFRGPLEILRGWDSRAGTKPPSHPRLTGSTWYFESCAFLEMNWPTSDALALPQEGGLRLVTCLADGEGASPDVRRSLADINPAWYVVR